MLSSLLGDVINRPTSDDCILCDRIYEEMKPQHNRICCTDEQYCPMCIDRYAKLEKLYTANNWSFCGQKAQPKFQVAETALEKKSSWRKLGLRAMVKQLWSKVKSLGAKSTRERTTQGWITVRWPFGAFGGFHQLASWLLFDCSLRGRKGNIA